MKGESYNFYPGVFFEEILFPSDPKAKYKIELAFCLLHFFSYQRDFNFPPRFFCLLQSRKLTSDFCFWTPWYSSVVHFLNLGSVLVLVFLSMTPIVLNCQCLDSLWQ